MAMLKGLARLLLTLTSMVLVVVLLILSFGLMSLLTLFIALGLLITQLQVLIRRAGSMRERGTTTPSER